MQKITLKERVLVAAEKNWKDLNKSVKAKEKVIHDLQKENERISENSLKLKADFTQFKGEVNKEKKETEKKLKKLEKKELVEDMKVKSKSLRIECTKCEFIADSVMKLKCHERSFHKNSYTSQTDEIVLRNQIVQANIIKPTSDKVMQYPLEEDCKVIEEEFQKYPCFYCGINIANNMHLSHHRRKCRGTTNMFSTVRLPSG